jgi:hypothetical protein
VANPLAADIETAAEAVELAASLRAARTGANLLPAGDMESDAHMRAAGWQHVQHEVEGTIAEAQLTSEAPHAGRFALRMTLQPADPQGVPLVATPPMWFESAPAAVGAGDFLRIRLWVRIATPITGSVDGLLVFDSLGGQALAERIGSTDGQWQEVTLYRAAPRAGAMTLTLAMTGFGTADIDDVSIERLEMTPIRGAFPATAALPTSGPLVAR